MVDLYGVFMYLCIYVQYVYYVYNIMYSVLTKPVAILIVNNFLLPLRMTLKLW